MAEKARRPLRVTFIEQFAVGGLFHYAHCLCQALAERGMDIALVSARLHELTDVPRAYRLLNHLPLWNPFAADRQMRRGLARRVEQAGKAVRYLVALWITLLTICRERPDIVHTSEIKFLFDLVLFLVPRRFRIVHTCHNVQRFVETDQEGIVHTGRLWHRAQWLMYRRCDGVIFHAEENLSEFRHVFGFEPARWAIIPHGEYAFFAPEERVSMPQARQQLGLDEAGPLVLFFGALRRYKGLDLLLEALPRLPNVHLLVAGAPLHDVSIQDLHAHARHLDVEDRVIWHLAYIPHGQVHLYFSACDVVALPYRKAYESGVLKIAQALGRPVVVTDTGGLASAVDSGRAGLIVPPEDPQALAQALETLLADPRLAESLARRGQDLARTEYSWASVAKRTADFYMGVLERDACTDGQ
jgi:glycosyltransferase involved in cell wall biosynthesis